VQRPEAGIEIVALNDLADDEMAAYLLKYDTVMGEFPGKVTVGDGYLVAGGHMVKTSPSRTRPSSPGRSWGWTWSSSPPRVPHPAEVAKHLEAGAKRVILNRAGQG